MDITKRIKSKKPSKIKRFIEHSFTVSSLSYHSIKLNSKLRNSSFGKAVFNVEKTDTVSENSFISSFFHNVYITSAFSSAKLFISKQIENSVIVNFYRKLIKGFFASSVRTLGVFFMSSGLYSLFALAIRLLWFKNVPRNALWAVSVALLIISALFLMCSKKTVAVKVCESKLLSGVIFGMLGINRLSIDTSKKPENHYAVAFFLGLFSGIMTLVLSPLVTIGFFITLLLLLMVLYSPESGICLSLFLATLFGSNAVTPVLITTLVSYILRLLRGKRNFSLKPEDVFALIFAFIWVISFPASTLNDRLVCAVAYIMIINLMRSVTLLKKGISCISLGLMASSFVKTIETVCKMFDFDFFDYLGYDIFSVMPDENMLFIISLLFSLFIFTKKDSSFSPVVRVLFVLSALFNFCMTLSQNIWLTFIVAYLIYSLIKNEKILASLSVFVLIVPVYHIIVKLFSNRFDISPLTPAAFTLSTDNFGKILFGGGYNGDGLFGLFVSSFGIMGILLLILFISLTIRRIITISSHVTDTDLKNICAILSATLSAFFVLGIFENTLSNECMMFMIWCVSGLISATGNTKHPTEYRDSRDLTENTEK